MSVTFPASEKTNRPVELGFHGKRGREQDGERHREGTNAQGARGREKARTTTSLETPRSGHTSALRVHFISLSWCHLPPVGKSRRRWSKGAQKFLLSTPLSP